MSIHYEHLDRQRLQERAKRLKEYLPPTVEPPDDVEPDSDVLSWEFGIDGHRATLNFMVAGARKFFLASQGDEIITVINQVRDAELNVEIRDRKGALAAQSPLRREGDRVKIEEGCAFRLVTGAAATGAALVEYVIEFPGQKPVVEDF